MEEDIDKIWDTYYEYRATKEGERMDELLKHLNNIAIDFCELHDVTCCTRKVYKHSHYQCEHNSDPIIASYQECRLTCHDIEQVEKYIAYIAAHELDSLINEKLETSHEARIMKGHISILLQLCIEEFSDNAYVIKYKERTLAAMESTNILQEENDENISFEEEVCEEESKEDIVQPKLGDVWEPLKDDSNTQTQNSFVIYANPCYDNCPTKILWSFMKTHAIMMQLIMLLYLVVILLEKLLMIMRSVV
jgi:hypothetical protein